MGRVWVRIVLAGVLCVGLATRVRGQASTLALRQLHHTAWTVRDGAPGDVAALAQSADGFLWLGTTTGLYRFDGVRFERYEPRGQALPSANISTLLALPDNSLWIGYRFGGASLLAGDHLVNYGEDAGCPPGTAAGLVRDSTGVIWIATSGGLARLVDGRWRPVGAEREFPKGSTSSLLVDRRGSLWAAAASGVFVLPRATSRFIRRAPPLGYGDPESLREAPDGSVWGASLSIGAVQLSTAKGDVPPAPRARGPEAITLFIGRDSSLWVSRIGHLERGTLAPQAGALRTAGAGTQQMARSEGLSGNTVTSFLQDREQSVWVGTEGGLDRFRVTKLTPVPLTRPLLGPALAPGDTGTMWSGNLSGPLMRISARVSEAPGWPRRVECAYRDAEGTLWVAGTTGMWRREGDEFIAVRLPAEVAGTAIQAIARDHAGKLWISVVGKGVFRRAQSTWSRVGSSWGLEGAPAITIVADPAGPVWLGYTHDRLVKVDGDSARLFTSAHGLHVGNVTALRPGGKALWIGGELGLMHFARGRFSEMRSGGGEALRGVSGIVQRAEGELWINGADGITRIPAIELARALGDTTYHPRHERFDFRDGVDGTALQIRPLPSAVEGTDGRLWFATSSSIVWIDPRSVRRNALAPPVVIRALEAADHSFPSSDTLILPRRTRALRINYTALSLAIPERVRFRYLLVGSDKSWQDGGPRREAFYTNLGPGTYEFHVAASNEDGVWNEAGAAMAIVIPPTFMQTRWFLLLCAVAASAVVWLLIQLRHRQLTNALHARFDVTLAERTRIAQELHDTLLQSFGGITLQLHAVRKLLVSRPTEAIALLSRTIVQADATMHDARNVVSDMRSPELDALELPEALASAAREAVDGAPIALRLTTSGSRRRLPRATEIVALRVGREAVTNAIKHAAPTAIEVDLRYEPRALVLRVCDDGRGFQRDEPERARSGGHWGIVGMRERALAAGGTVEIASTPHHGTMVSLTLPLSELSNASSTQ